MFSYIRLISMIRECKNPEDKKTLGVLRDEIYARAGKYRTEFGIKGYINVNKPDHAAALNKAGQEYLMSLEQTPLVVSVLNGTSIDGEREKKIEANDFSFTHDDSAASVFSNLGKVCYMSSWQQSNILRYITVSMALLNNRNSEDPKNQTVVDVGCSEGSFLQFWYNNMQVPGKQKLHYTGIEVVEESISKAKKQFNGRDNIKFVQADMMKTRLKDIHPQAADVVLLLEVIEHVGLDSARDLLNDAFSTLRPGGIICISSPNPQKQLGQQFVWIDNHLYEFSLPEMKQEIADAGFEICDVTGWYADLPTLKREFSEEQEKMYAQFKLLGPQMATSLMAHLMPEFAKHYTIIAKKPFE